MLDLCRPIPLKDEENSSVYYFMLCFSKNYSQENYTINGKTHQLKTEIEGQLDLLQTISGNTYRYFIRTEDGVITEFKNTRFQGNDHENHKITIEKLTNGLSTKRLKFRLYNLMHYNDNQNSKVNFGYASTFKRSNLKLRSEVSGETINNPFVKNSDNINVPLL